jgi:hypothetical protein
MNSPTSHANPISDGAVSSKCAVSPGVEKHLRYTVRRQEPSPLLGLRTQHRALDDAQIEKWDQECHEHPGDLAQQRSDDDTDERIGHCDEQKIVGPPMIPLLGLSTARGGVHTSRTAMGDSQKCQLCRRTTVNDVVESHKCHGTNVLDALS